MKKLITILMVMIVLVCSVYADIQTSLDLYILLTAQVPSFRLSITSDTDVTSAASLDSGSGASPSSALSASSLETLLSSSGQVTVNFALSQITNARLTGSHASTYTLSVETTDLILQVNGACPSRTRSGREKSWWRSRNRRERNSGAIPRRCTPSSLT